MVITDAKNADRDEIAAQIKILVGMSDEDEGFDQQFYKVMGYYSHEFGSAITLFGGIMQVQDFMLGEQVEFDGKTPLSVMFDEGEEGRARVNRLFEKLHQLPAYQQPTEEW